MRGHGGSRPVTLSRCRPRQIYSASVLLSVLCLAVLVINLYEVRMMQVDHATLHVPPQQPPPPPPPAPTALDRRVSRPIVWVYGKKVSQSKTCVCRLESKCKCNIIRSSTKFSEVSVILCEEMGFYRAAAH